MTDLSRLADMAEILGALVVIGGLNVRARPAGHFLAYPG